MQYDLGPLNDLPEGEIITKRLGGRDVLLARQDRQVFAVKDICPHQGAKLSKGVLCGSHTAGCVGEHEIINSGRVVRCPWHNWEFGLTDGRCLHDPDKLRVTSYKIELKDEHVFVEL